MTTDKTKIKKVLDDLAEGFTMPQPDIDAMLVAMDDVYHCIDDVDFAKGFEAGMLWAMRDAPATADGVRVLPWHHSIWINPGTNGWMSIDEGWCSNRHDPPIEIKTWVYHGDHIWFATEEAIDGYYWDSKLYSSKEEAIKGNPIAYDDHDLLEEVEDILEPHVESIRAAVDLCVQRPVTEEEYLLVESRLEHCKRCVHCGVWIDGEHDDEGHWETLQEYDACVDCCKKAELQSVPDDED